MREGAFVGRRIVLVALEDRRTTNDDFADFTRW